MALCPACDAEIEMDEYDVAPRAGPRPSRGRRVGGVSNIQALAQHLDDILVELGSLVVAYSGGVDSAYLAVRAHLVLGERSLAVTADSESLADSQRRMALRIARDFGLRHRWLRTNEIEDPAYTRNGSDRCFHCKAELFRKLGLLARAEGYGYVAYGAIADDLGDVRPGHRAAQQAGVRSPLLDAGLTKAHLRVLSRDLGLPTWDQPSSPCLASRIPYGTPVTSDALRRIERAEAAVRAFGFRELRVRDFGRLARVEIAPDEMGRIAAEGLETALREAVRGAGYDEVLFDPEGYRRGRLNEALTVVSA
jgi:uncharacterized protein